MFAKILCIALLHLHIHFLSHSSLFLSHMHFLSHSLIYTFYRTLSYSLTLSLILSLLFTLTSIYALFASYCCFPSLLLFYFPHYSPDNTLVCCGTSPLRSDPNSKSLLCFYEVKKSNSSSLNINDLPVLQIAVEGGGISAVMVKWHGVTNQILCR